MTPQQHYTYGEQLIALVERPGNAMSAESALQTTVQALTHFVAAVAGELGVPTGTVQSGTAPTLAAPPAGQSEAG